MAEESKWIAAIVCFLMFLALIMPKDEENLSVKFADAAEQAALNQEYEENQGGENNLEISGLKTANEDDGNSNPFTYFHESRDDGSVEHNIKTEVVLKSETIDAKANADEKGPKIPEPKPDKPEPSWKLTGVVIAGESKTAILSRENETKTLAAGDMFDDKTIVSIEKDYILYSGASGQGRLILSQP